MRLLILTAIAVLVHGCANVTAPAPARMIAQPPRALTLVDVPDPPRLAVLVVGHPDATASQTRQIFYGNAMATAARDLRAALAPQAVRPGPLLTDAIVKALTRDGHAVSRSADFQAEREDLLEDYARIASGGRVLDVVPLAIGYWTTYPDKPYRPWVVLQYRVHDAANRATIASGLIGTGPSPGSAPIVAVPQDDRYAFASFDAVRADPQRAADGLRATIEQVATALAVRL